MIVGVDAWSRHDEEADHLAHLVCEVVGALAVGALARTPGPGRPVADLLDEVVVATHGVPGVLGGEPHHALSCVLPDGLGPHPQALLDGLVSLVGDDGAVVVTGAGLGDGLTHGRDPGALAGAWVAVTTAVTGVSGRLVRFPGWQRLRGTLTVADVLSGSLVDEVVVVGGSPHSGDTLVETREFVRPRVQDRRVLLHVQPALGGVLVPFEKERPERCCEDH